MEFHCSQYLNVLEIMSKYKLQNAREIAAKIAERLVEASGTEETGEDEELYEGVYESLYNTLKVWDKTTLDNINSLI